MMNSKAMALIGLCLADLCMAKPELRATVMPGCAITANKIKASPAIGMSVCVELDATTYGSYGNGSELAYYFTNTNTGGTVVLTGQTNRPKPCFRLPAGTYQLVIKTKPQEGVGQSSSKAYDFTIPQCPAPRQSPPRARQW